MSKSVIFGVIAAVGMSAISAQAAGYKTYWIQAIKEETQVEGVPAEFKSRCDAMAENVQMRLNQVESRQTLRATPSADWEYFLHNCDTEFPNNCAAWYRQKCTIQVSSSGGNWRFQKVEMEKRNLNGASPEVVCAGDLASAAANNAVVFWKIKVSGLFKKFCRVEHVQAFAKPSAQ